jgi:hypothetical protein
LLAATKPFGNMPLAEAQTPQGGRKICSLSHGGRLGLLGQLDWKKPSPVVQGWGAVQCEN